VAQVAAPDDVIMTNRNKFLFSVLALLIIAIAGRTWLAFRSPPQIPPSDEVFRTVDALFTAVTAHDEKRLADCEQRLGKYKAAGSLPAAAAKRIDGVIATARSGQWDSAARRLYDFIHGQRRDGTPLPSASRQTAMNVKK